MRRLTPGRGPSSRPGQLCAVEETPSQKLDSLSRNRRLSRASSIPARQFQAGCPIEKPIPKTKTKKNEPTRRQIYNRTTPGEKGGLASRCAQPVRGFRVDRVQVGAVEKMFRTGLFPHVIQHAEGLLVLTSSFRGVSSQTDG